MSEISGFATTPSATDLATHIRQVAAQTLKQKRRFLVGIVGAPGAGKSTLAQKLAETLGEGAAVVPMDGYHLDNVILAARGLLEQKGAPQTFDADGFAHMLARLRQEQDVIYPLFDRALDLARAGAGNVGANDKIVLVEGNYLLLDQVAWRAMAIYFDMTLSLEVARGELEKRLIARWIDYGFSKADATFRALRNDMVNVDLVQNQSRKADIVVRQG